jgi:GT2 family glycosyltransferase
VTDKETRVIAVVLSWNRRDDTLACLRSLARVEYAPLDVVLVDNGSDDGSVEAVRREFPRADVVENAANLGYAEGMNIGMSRALDRGAAYVLLLNNDTAVERTFLGHLVEEAERSPGAAALCPRINFFDPPYLVWYAGARFDPARGYNGRMTGYRKPEWEQPTGVYETDRACGAAMLVPREALERVGLFAPALFAYDEDTEWSLRAKRLGYSLLVVAQSRVWHNVSSSSGGEGSPDTLYYHTRNLLEVSERFAPRGRVGTWRRRLTVLGAHGAQALLSGRAREGLRATAEGFADFRRRRFGRRPGTRPRAPGRSAPM